MIQYAYICVCAFYIYIYTRKLCIKAQKLRLAGLSPLLASGALASTLAFSLDIYRGRAFLHLVISIPKRRRAFSFFYFFFEKYWLLCIAIFLFKIARFWMFITFTFGLLAFFTLDSNFSQAIVRKQEFHIIAYHWKWNVFEIFNAKTKKFSVKFNLFIYSFRLQAHLGHRIKYTHLREWEGAKRASRSVDKIAFVWL